MQIAQRLSQISKIKMPSISQYHQWMQDLAGTRTMAYLIDALPFRVLQLHLVIEGFLLEEAADVLGAVQKEFVQKLILQHCSIWALKDLTM